MSDEITIVQVAERIADESGRSGGGTARKANLSHARATMRGSSGKDARERR